MNKRNTIININGNQVNIAKDKAKINAIQNNKIETNELETILEEIEKNFDGLNNECVEKILDVLEKIENEFNEITPKKSNLKNYLNIILTIITGVNGVPELGDNFQKLYNFILNTIKKLYRSRRD